MVGGAECIAVAYMYGAQRLADDVEEMTGKRVPAMFLFMWRYTTPVLCACLSVLAVSNEINKPVSIVDAHYKVPPFARAIGWLIATVGLIPVIWWLVKHWGHGHPADDTVRASSDGSDGPVRPTDKNIDDMSASTSMGSERLEKPADEVGRVLQSTFQTAQYI
jgi:hypothetical protein